MPFLELPNTDVQEKATRQEVGTNIISELIDPNQPFLVDYKTNIETVNKVELHNVKKVNNSSSTSTNEEEEGELAMARKHGSSRMKSWRKDGNNRRKEQSKRKKRAQKVLASETEEERKARLERQRKAVAEWRKSKSTNDQDREELSFLKQPSSGASLDPFLRRDQAKYKYVLTHTIERSEKHIYTHERVELEDGDGTSGLLFTSRPTSSGGSQLVNVTEVTDNSGSAYDGNYTDHRSQCSTSTSGNSKQLGEHAKHSVTPKRWK